MAGIGPPPKENRRRRNAATYSDITSHLEDDCAEAPELEGEWRPEVTRWYETWVNSPQSSTFTATDWQRLLFLAPLVEDYFKRPTAMKMAEIRQNESLLGATHMDRLRGRMKVEKPGVNDGGKTKLAAVEDLKKRLAS